jgi:hypothetical protein
MTDPQPLAGALVLAGCAMGLAGCAMATLVDVGKTVVKIPFMLGKGVYDVLTEEPPLRREPALAPPRADAPPAQAEEPVAVPTG